MNIPRPQLEEALLRVKQGSMQPDEAARWLMQCTDKPAMATTPCTVAELMNQLGPPPWEIQQDWDRQFVRIAAQFEQAYGEPLPPITAADLYVDDQNRLMLSSTLHPDEQPKPSVAAAPNDSATDGSVTNRFVVDELTKSPLSASKPASHESTAGLPSLSNRRPWLKPGLLGASVCVLLALASYGLLGTARRDTSEDATRSTTASKQNASPASSIFSPTRIAQDRSASDASLPNANALSGESREPTSDELSSDIVSMSNDVIGDLSATTSPESTPPDSVPERSKSQGDAPERETLGLSTFGDGDWVSANELLPTADFDAVAKSPDAESSSDPMKPVEDLANTEELALDQPAGGDDIEAQDDVAVESPIQHVTNSNAIELPPLPASSIPDDDIQSTDLIEGEFANLSLLFPVETEMVLSAKEKGWELRDMKDQSLLASFAKVDGGIAEGKTGLQFRWTSEAIRHSVARQLPSGLLRCTFKDGTERSLFLRHPLTAEPWQIDFSSGDVKAAWPILLAPPVGPSLLEIDFEVPKTVIHTWIEAHDPKRVRRSQSICQFALESDSTIAIRSRIDLRTGSRIQLRLRHAAQLAPSFPWQMISTEQVETAISQVTSQLERAGFKYAELKAAYSDASTTAKRSLAPQRDAMESIVQRLKTLNDRLHKFDQLLAQIDQTTLMKIRLKVTWPETSPLTEQTIFEMNSPE